MPAVLFVCTGNTCRSPMASLLLQKWAQDHSLDLQVRSAGIHALPNSPISPLAAKVLCKYGIEEIDHKASFLQEEWIHWADVIYVMTEMHRQQIQRIPNLADKVHILGSSLGIEDPYGGDEEVYERCFQRIQQAVQQAMEERGWLPVLPSKQEGPSSAGEEKGG